MLDLNDEHIPVALALAFGAHAAVKQKRKYTGEDYIVHPMAVARTVAQCPSATVEMVVAALLHDVLEDTGVTLAQLKEFFGVGSDIPCMVESLTDKFTPEEYPEVNRAGRKEMEARRYVYESGAVKTIKLADMIDNTESIGQHDPKFLKTYGPEKRRLLESLCGGDATLWGQADTILKGYGY